MTRNKQFYETARAALNDQEAKTSWNELSVAGKELQESATTTLPPNSRFITILNDDVETPTGTDDTLTHEPPLYAATIDAGDDLIIRGSERNAYKPGFDSIAGVAATLEETGPAGNFTADGVTFRCGYARLREGDKQGFVFEFEGDAAKVAIYQDDTIVAEKDIDEWDNNPFDDPDVNWSLDKFAVYRIEFDLYGAGDATFFAKIRKENGEADYTELTTLGIQDDPNLTVYNLPVSWQVVNDSGDPFTASMGPLHYFNVGEAPLPERTKQDTLWDVTIDEALDNEDADYTVISVYRLAPDYEEAATNLKSIEAQSTDVGQIEGREVHPDYLTGLDEVDWIAPGSQMVRETSIQRADIDPGTATLATFEDADGVTKARGKQIGVVHTAGQEGGPSDVSDQDAIDISAKTNEYFYIAIIGQVESPPQDFDRVSVRFDQRW